MMQPISQKTVQKGFVEGTLLYNVGQPPFLGVDTVKMQRIGVAQNNGDGDIGQTVHRTIGRLGERHALIRLVKKYFWSGIH